jgi:hypothetical protein
VEGDDGLALLLLAREVEGVRVGVEALRAGREVEGRPEPQAEGGGLGDQRDGDPARAGARAVAEQLEAARAEAKVLDECVEVWRGAGALRRACCQLPS